MFCALHLVATHQFVDDRAVSISFMTLHEAILISLHPYRLALFPDLLEVDNMKHMLSTPIMLASCAMFTYWYKHMLYRTL